MQFTCALALLAVALPAVMASPAGFLYRDDGSSDSSTPAENKMASPSHRLHPGSVSAHGQKYDHKYSAHSMSSTWSDSQDNKFVQSQAAYHSTNKCQGHSGEGDQCDTWNSSEASGEVHAESESEAGESHESTEKEDLDYEEKDFDKEVKVEKHGGEWKEGINNSSGSQASSDSTSDSTTYTSTTDSSTQSPADAPASDTVSSDEDEEGLDRRQVPVMFGSAYEREDEVSFTPSAEDFAFERDAIHKGSSISFF